MEKEIKIYKNFPDIKKLKNIIKSIYINNKNTDITYYNKPRNKKIRRYVRIKYNPELNGLFIEYSGPADLKKDFDNILKGFIDYIINKNLDNYYINYIFNDDKINIYNWQLGKDFIVDYHIVETKFKFDFIHKLYDYFLERAIKRLSNIEYTYPISYGDILSSVYKSVKIKSFSFKHIEDRKIKTYFIKTDNVEISIEKQVEKQPSKLTISFDYDGITDLSKIIKKLPAKKHTNIKKEFKSEIDPQKNTPQDITNILNYMVKNYDKFNFVIDIHPDSVFSMSDTNLTMILKDKEHLDFIRKMIDFSKINLSKVNMINSWFYDQEKESHVQIFPHSSEIYISNYSGIFHFPFWNNKLLYKILLHHLFTKLC